ncbi:MAG TPA: hypothetical protein DEB18_10055 [Leeuwenhoekiella sp.]|nr:hypothetical protein [Leeuwenhoekiella sp.]
MSKNSITLSKEDRIELLRLISSLDKTLEEATETFDLHLSDLRTLTEFQWTLIRKLKIVQNPDQETKYINPFILKEDEKGDS